MICQPEIYFPGRSSSTIFGTTAVVQADHESDQFKGLPGGSLVFIHRPMYTHMEVDGIGI